jgi:hypothetical protein
MELKEIIENFKNISWNEIAYWMDCRPMFEVIYSNKENFIKEFPQKKEMIEELCATDSQQDFLRVLKKYETEEDKNNIWVHENEEGDLYLI